MALSCEGRVDVLELFSDSVYLSAILDRQGLLVAAPIDLRTKTAEILSPQLLRGFWSMLKKKNPKIVVMPPTVSTKGFQQKALVWQPYRLCLSVTEHHISGGKHFLIMGPESEKIWWLKKVQYLQKKYHCRWTSLRGKKPKWILHKFGHLLRPQKLVPASREQVVPTEWQVRTVFGDFMSKARVITFQTPRYRQCALISDFLYLASLSIREEAAATTNWIKDRPEGMKLQNLTLASMTGPVLSSLLRNLTADVQYAIEKGESLGPGQQWILHGNPSAYLQRIFARIWQSFGVIFAEYAV